MANKLYEVTIDNNRDYLIVAESTEQAIACASYYEVRDYDNMGDEVSASEISLDDIESPTLLNLNDGYRRHMVYLIIENMAQRAFGKGPEEEE